MKTLFLFLFISLSLFTSAQKKSEYIQYYNLVNEGDKQIYLGNDSLAYQFYKEGFKRVDYVHNTNLIKASQLASSLGYNRYCYKLLQCAFKQGEDINILDYEPFVNFKNTKYYKKLVDNYPKYKASFLTSLNIDYKKQIDSLYYIDQYIVRGNTNIKGNYQIDYSLDIQLLDSLIFTEFLSLIDKYGFATEKNIGPESFKKVWVFFHHNIRLPENNEYIPLAQEALLQGSYLPQNYAWMYDQSMTYNNNPPYFYYGVASIENLTDDEKVEINKRRKNWGVKPIESTLIETIKENGRISIMQTTLW